MAKAKIMKIEFLPAKGGIPARVLVIKKEGPAMSLVITGCCTRENAGLLAESLGLELEVKQ